MPERGSAAPGSPLPCLNTNNCDRVASIPEEKRPKSRQKKVAFSLQENVKQFAERYGLEKLGFLTLTFAEHITDPKEAARRFHNLSRRVLKRYQDWIRVYERQKSGRVHYHLLVVMHDDIRTGVNFEAFANGNYGSAGAKLRAEWAFWRNAARSYGFGRTELLPVRSNAEGIGRYVGKYIAKHMDQRKEADKGVRLVGYSRGARKINANFDWNTPGAELWRAKLGLFARSMGASSENYQAKFKDWFGSHWAFHLREPIASIILPTYRTGVHFLIDNPLNRSAPEWQHIDPSECENMAWADDRSARSVANVYRFAVALRNVHQSKQRRPTGGRTSGVDDREARPNIVTPFGRSAPSALGLKSNMLAEGRYDVLGAIRR